MTQTQQKSKLAKHTINKGLYSDWNTFGHTQITWGPIKLPASPPLTKEKQMQSSWKLQFKFNFWPRYGQSHDNISLINFTHPKLKHRPLFWQNVIELHATTWFPSSNHRGSDANKWHLPTQFFNNNMANPTTQGPYLDWTSLGDIKTNLIPSSGKRGRDEK